MKLFLNQQDSHFCQMLQPYVEAVFFGYAPSGTVRTTPRHIKFPRPADLTWGFLADPLPTGGAGFHLPYCKICATSYQNICTMFIVIA